MMKQHVTASRVRRDIRVTDEKGDQLVHQRHLWPMLRDHADEIFRKQGSQSAQFEDRR